MSNYAAPHQIADAIESLEWKGCSIGHKVILANAVAALRATQPAAPEPVAYCDDFTLGKLKSALAYSVGVTPAAQRHGGENNALYVVPPAAAHGDELVAVVGTVPDGSGFKSLDFKVDLQDLPDGTKLYAMRAQRHGEVQ